MKIDRQLKQELLDAIAADVLDPVDDDEITAGEYARLVGVSYEVARRRLNQRVESAGWSRRMALGADGRPVNAYRRGAA